jgi:hypothetical protein
MAAILNVTLKFDSAPFTRNLWAAAAFDTRYLGKVQEVMREIPDIGRESF